MDEDDKSYTVRAEIPGVKKEDIQVDVEGSHVSLRTEVKKEREEKEGKNVVYSERSYGMVSRGFELPREVDDGGTKAFLCIAAARYRSARSLRLVGSADLRNGVVHTLGSSSRGCKPIDDWNAWELAAHSRHIICSRKRL